MMKKPLPQINAGSMADIAFLLLIFFLVATTMQRDEGLMRVLAPNVESPPSQIPEENILQISVNDDDQLLVNDDYMLLKDLKRRAIQFLTDTSGAGTKAKEKILNLSISDGSSYGRYVQIQDALQGAYNELRDDLSLSRYGVPYTELDKNLPADRTRILAIRAVYPLRIAEGQVTN